MRLGVISHKRCWAGAPDHSVYASDGGFPLQISALSDLFDATRVVVPCATPRRASGAQALQGNNLSVVPLSLPKGTGLTRKLRFPYWLTRNGRVLWREVRQAHAIYAPIPGDIGTVGILLALLLNKPLLVRYCGNWQRQRTLAERFWKWLMEHIAGGKRVMLVSGGAPKPPSTRNPHLHWIFSTSVGEAELANCGRPRSAPPPGQARLIIVSRQERGKGVETVIDSLTVLRSIFPAVSLAVVGDGSARAELEQRAKTKGVADLVVFHGQVDHASVLRLLKEADLFCFPTSSEGFPKVVLEALACGLPVITTPVSVLPYLINTGCGQLIPDPTPVAVAQAVQSCLVDARTYEAMSSQAIRLARNYTLEQWRKLIAEILEDAWGPLRLAAPQAPDRRYVK